MLTYISHMADKRILWVTPKWPLPVADGARVATVNLLKPLCSHLDNIDILALAGSDEECDQAELRDELGLKGQILVYRRSPVGSGIGRKLRNITLMVTRPSMPVTIIRYAAARLRRSFADFLRRQPVGLVVFDGLHCAGLWAENGSIAKPENVKCIYRAHNVETMIWQRAAEHASTRIEKKALLRQRKLMARFETSLLQQAELVAAVSTDDVDEFRHFAPGVPCRHVPIGLDFSCEPPGFPKKLNLLYVGRLDWPPNRDGLRWFLDHVWPRVTREDLTLTVAGSGDGSWLKPYRSLPRIDFKGFVDDVNELYAQSAAAIVPIFYGSGTRLKVIEPARFSRCCISTKAGVFGSVLDANTYVPAETSSEWLDVLDNLDLGRLREVGERARMVIKDVYERNKVAAAFADQIKGLMG